MRNKISALAALTTLSLVSVGCTNQQVADNEMKAKQVLSSIANGARVAASVVMEGIDAVCSNGADVNAAAGFVRIGFNTQSGPQTSQNLANLDASLTALGNVCDRATANPNDPALKALLKTAWAAYQEAKAAQAKLAKGN